MLINFFVLFGFLIYNAISVFFLLLFYRVYDECLNTFIVWSGPLLMSVLYFFMSFFTHFLRADVLEDQIKNLFQALGALLDIGLY